ncbi:MAG: hypothetical protein ACFCD0_14110 [Gemmataceae bacterium]
MTQINDSNQQKPSPPMILAAGTLVLLLLFAGLAGLLIPPYLNQITEANTKQKEQLKELQREFEKQKKSQQSEKSTLTDVQKKALDTLEVKLKTEVDKLSDLESGPLAKLKEDLQGLQDDLQDPKKGKLTSVQAKLKEALGTIETLEKNTKELTDPKTGQFAKFRAKLMKDFGEPKKQIAALQAAVKELSAAKTKAVMDAFKKTLDETKTAFAKLKADLQDPKKGTLSGLQKTIDDTKKKYQDMIAKLTVDFNEAKKTIAKFSKSISDLEKGQLAKLQKVADESAKKAEAATAMVKKLATTQATNLKTGLQDVAKKVDALSKDLTDPKNGKLTEVEVKLTKLVNEKSKLIETLKTDLADKTTALTKENASQKKQIDNLTTLLRAAQAELAKTKAQLKNSEPTHHLSVTGGQYLRWTKNEVACYSATRKQNNGLLWKRTTKTPIVTVDVTNTPPTKMSDVGVYTSDGAVVYLSLTTGAVKKKQ